MATRFLILALALVLDRLIGDPDWLWRRLPHPVVLFGKAIDRCDADLNDDEDSAETRWRHGVFAIAILLAASAFVGLVLTAIFYSLGVAGVILEIAALSIFLAQKSLSEHVGRVANALQSGGLDEARRAVSQIVGRDPEGLDAPAIGRAAIESLSENFSDGVVAPAFWYLILGLPGLLAYKMLNTADSMIGHKDARHLHFGRAAARLDDVANWIPARMSAAFLVLSAAIRLGPKSARRAAGAVLRDAGLHRSPNAGWPEAAMAGALGVALSGPRSYGKTPVMEPYLNAKGRADVVVGDVDCALMLFGWSCSLMFLVAALPTFCEMLA
ncbi:adenosylcobinamide-phosphate synthase CbiB [Hoeflea sp. WL0058]|uniref:Cobalamin biosynthesis protein CobD n=1 Tax=Flavimaribacter sediminis TaxID=2865987 RepID=A0AAE2ZG86_9HYPH|nr:adenosylcobinamide-phosphate synthase CbiB [Flavimaribacter sediminis]MBW8636003.1 adenosylcobinamide-phosphate synthase CbiB [Flavimaribacter sediminis]